MEVAEDRQAIDIVLLDIRSVSIVADYFVICSGNSERQLGALTREITETIEREARVSPLHSSRHIGCTGTMPDTAASGGGRRSSGCAVVVPTGSARLVTAPALRPAAATAATPNPLAGGTWGRYADKHDDAWKRYGTGSSSRSRVSTCSSCSSTASSSPR